MWSNRTASSDGYRRRAVGVVKAGGVLGSNNRVVVIGSHKDRSITAVVLSSGLVARVDVN